MAQDDKQLDMATAARPGQRRRARGSDVGLADAGFLPQSAPDAKPHYLGHRQRLRDRLLDAGAAALPDYELLEFLLTAALPRGSREALLT